MEAWRKAWREGVAPCLTDRQLRALFGALHADYANLLQGVTTDPAPAGWLAPLECEGACAVGYCGWKGDGLETVGQVEEFFAKVCFEVDSRLGEPGAVCYFLNWYDETPRDVMRRELGAEVQRALQSRQHQTLEI